MSQSQSSVSKSFSQVSESKKININGMVFESGVTKPDFKAVKKCFKCKLDLVTKELPAPEPYNKKVVCAHCDNFVRWGNVEIDDALAAKIDSFFKNTNLRDKFYMSLFYQWSKKRSLSVKQIEILYQHVDWK